MSLIRHRRLLIRLAAATKNPGAKLILNRLHRHTRKELAALRWEAKLQGMSVAAEEEWLSFGALSNRLKIVATHHLHQLIMTL
jgi:hypothetical protein